MRFTFPEPTKKGLGRKAVNLQLATPLHSRLKSIAQERGITMASVAQTFLKAAIEEYDAELDQHGPKISTPRGQR